MLLKPCARCGKLIMYGRPYCPACQDEVDEEKLVRTLERKRYNNRQYNRRRDPKYTRFYNSTEWRRLSQAKLIDASYKCERCGCLAVEVHHIVHVQTDEGWDLRFAWPNLQALCLDCHNKAHGRWQKKQTKH